MVVVVDVVLVVERVVVRSLVVEVLSVVAFNILVVLLAKLAMVWMLSMVMVEMVLTLTICLILALARPQVSHVRSRVEVVFCASWWWRIQRPASGGEAGGNCIRGHCHGSLVYFG